MACQRTPATRGAPVAELLGVVLPQVADAGGHEGVDGLAGRRTW